MPVESKMKFWTQYKDVLYYYLKDKTKKICIIKNVIQWKWLSSSLLLLSFSLLCTIQTLQKFPFVLNYTVQYWYKVKCKKIHHHLNWSDKTYLGLKRKNMCIAHVYVNHVLRKRYSSIYCVFVIPFHVALSHGIPM